VSLLRFDQRTGRLSPAATVPLAGVLPEGGTFDPTGRWFLASVFQDTPGVQIYRVDPKAGTLVPDRRITLPHGAHHVVMPTHP
jgi:6-phosphogluconolactonase (cycloisomerase 2 family)